MIGAIDEAKKKARPDKPTAKTEPQPQPEPKPEPEVEHAAADTHQS
jgi:hypothetical protein